MSDSTPATDDPRLGEFLRELSSKAPTPGGGAVAGLCGALAAALTAMVANLTIGKKKYVEVSPEFETLALKMESAITDLRVLMEEDKRVFEVYMTAWRLPKSDDTEKALRKEALRVATLDASEVPLRSLAACRDLLPAIRFAAEKGNRNAVSDAGIAALLVTCGGKAAAMNVRINLSGLEGDDHSKIATELAAMEAATYEEAAAIESMVNEALA